MSRFMSALLVVAAFALGIEAVVGYVLGASAGLSEMHKTVLVAFLVGFPLLALVALLPISARATRAEALAEAGYPDEDGAASPAE